MTIKSLIHIFSTKTKLKNKLNNDCLNLRDEGDSTVILCSQEHTAREVRILNFYSRKSIPLQLECVHRKNKLQTPFGGKVKYKIIRWIRIQ